METLFGLPAHSLLIHAPIVLLPIAALLTVVLAVRPGWRKRFGWSLVAGLLAVVVMLFLAKESGEAFEEAFDGAVDVRRHAELADATFVLTLLWSATFVALVGYEFAQRRAGAPATLSAGARSVPAIPALRYGLAVATSVFAVLATIWLIRTGHEGADVVWGDTTDLLFRR